MKTLSVVLVSVAMLASVSFAAANTTANSSNEPSAEERFKMKTGRYTQAEEARRQSSGAMDCMGKSCCRHGQTATHQHTAQAAVPFAGQWLQAKSGRNPSVQSAQVEVLSSDTVTAPAWDQWQRTKLGRSNSTAAAPVLAATPVMSSCIPGCCE